MPTFQTSYDIGDHFWVPRVYELEFKSSEIVVDGKTYVEKNPQITLNAIAKKKIVKEIEISVTEFGIDVNYWCSNPGDDTTIASKINHNAKIFNTEEEATRYAQEMLKMNRTYYG